MVMLNLWDQQAKESSKAFGAFVAYRDLDWRRSCSAVAAQLGLTAQSMLELSKRHSWQERVRSWNPHVDKEFQEEQIEAVKTMKRLPEFADNHDQ